MRIVIQRVKSASCTIDGKIFSEIDNGFLILVGFTHTDDISLVKKLANKVSKLRVFSDANGKMNLGIKEVNGKILSISQFTLYADPTHGNRPSFTLAKKPEEASLLYDAFNDALKELCLDVKTGIFGADMQISLVNDGPVTIIYDEENGE